MVRIASIDEEEEEEEEKEIETTAKTTTTAATTATNPKSESTKEKEKEKEKEKKKKKRKSVTKGGKSKSQSITDTLKKEKPIKLHSLGVPEPFQALAYPCEQMVRKIPNWMRYLVIYIYGTQINRFGSIFYPKIRLTSSLVILTWILPEE